MPPVAPEPTSTAGGNLLVRGAVTADWPASDGDRVAPGRRIDVRIADGRIASVEPELGPLPGELAVEVPGAVALPGLHDHHLHLRSLVAGGRSAAVGPGDVGSRDELTRALRRAPVDRHGWRRAVGYHESVAGELDRWSLDALVPDGPVRVQHRSGVVWLVNSAGADALGLDEVHQPGVELDAQGRPTGRLFRMDDWLAERLPDEDPTADVGPVSAQLASWGVTGMTDATPDATHQGVAAFVEAVADGRLCQRVHVMCPADLEMAPHALVTRGPHKVLLDDDRLPALEDLAEMVRGAHGARVPVAVHCVTPAQLALTVATFAEAGVVPGDRVEHASVVHPQLAGRLAELALTVVTNPGLVQARGDSYLVEVDDRDVAYLYPCASLIDAGVAVAAGTDAPFGPADPWAAVRTAVTRRTSGGRTLGAHEEVSLAAAVGLFAGRADLPGRPRRLAPGEPGDLCLLADGAVPQPGRSGSVLATIVAGRVVYEAS
jgi:predicted amidohydrolase YtcJ